MLEGLFAAASGMEAQQQALQALSNDLANQDTPGYQAARVGFHDLLYTSAGPGEPATGAGTAVDDLGRSMTQGTIQQTGRSLDVAISGEGYLQVRRPDGTIGLTRNGTLEMDAQGQITDEQGDLLWPPVTLPRGAAQSNVKIAPDGTVSAGNRRVGKLSIVTVAAPDKLQDAGGGVLVATAASGPIRAAAGQIQQGSLEGSNVDVATEMVDMISTQEGYQEASQSLSFQDQMLQIANGVKK